MLLLLIISLWPGWWDSLWGSRGSSGHVRGSEAGVEAWGSLSVVTAPWHAWGRATRSASSHHVRVTIAWGHRREVSTHHMGWHWRHLWGWRRSTILARLSITRWWRRHGREGWHGHAIVWWRGHAGHHAHASHHAGHHGWWCHAINFMFVLLNDWFLWRSVSKHGMRLVSQ